MTKKELHAIIYESSEANAVYKCILSILSQSTFLDGTILHHMVDEASEELKCQRRTHPVMDSNVLDKAIKLTATVPGVEIVEVE